MIPVTMIISVTVELTARKTSLAFTRTAHAKLDIDLIKAEGV